MHEPLTPKESHVPQAPQAQKHLAWRSILGLIVVLLVVPATVVLGTMFQKRAYILISMGIVVLSMAPFFVSFERRRPQARELVTLAVMTTLAIVSRAVFAFVPQFKPMAGLIMITGIAFGASSGFLAGSLSVFVSNFIFGQGPWTPWQMLAFGLCGYVFGLLADRGIIPRDSWSMKTRIVVSFGGALFIQMIAGPILDTSSLFWMLGTITPETMLAVYGAGIPINAIHALATFVTLFLLGNPILDKLSRLKTKYGLMPSNLRD